MAKNDKGWVKISRDLLDSAMWQRETPFEERSAWIDLILMVNHEDGEVFDKKGNVVNVPRGSCYTSIRKLADRWHWSTGKVLRYFDSLKKAKMITQTGTQTGTLVSLVNYDKFQGQRNTGGRADGIAPDRTPGRADGIRTRNKEIEEEKNTRVGARQHRRNPTMAEKMAAIEERRQRLIREEQERLKGEQNDGD